MEPMLVFCLTVFLAVIGAAALWAAGSEPRWEKRRD
jgi:hypothetical protein